MLHPIWTARVHRTRCPVRGALTLTVPTLQRVGGDSAPFKASWWIQPWHSNPDQYYFTTDVSDLEIFVADFLGLVFTIKHLLKIKIILQLFSPKCRSQMSDYFYQ